MNISRSIKVAMAMKDKKQKDLCREIGLSQPYFSLVKNGRNEPSVQVVRAIAENMGYTVSEFIALGEE